ncbi:hypothetical protein [Marisediminitalea sp.]
MKAWMICALLPTLSWARQGPFMETGAGIEYGGFGAQVVLPTPIKSLEMYVATGFLDNPSNEENSIGAGVGANYFVNRHVAFGLYGGILEIDSFTDETGYVEYDRKLGGSIGAKIYFSGQGKSGFVLGATYNYSPDGDSFPFISLAYRY